MLRALIIKEWLTSLLELRFVICAALCVILGIVSVVVLRADLEARRVEFSKNQSLYKDQAQEYGSFRQLERQGIRVDRPVLWGREDPGSNGCCQRRLSARFPG
jgi:hypothetical protein